VVFSYTIVTRIYPQGGIVLTSTIPSRGLPPLTTPANSLRISFADYESISCRLEEMIEVFSYPSTKLPFPKSTSFVAHLSSSLTGNRLIIRVFYGVLSVLQCVFNGVHQAADVACSCPVNGVKIHSLLYLLAPNIK